MFEKNLNVGYLLDFYGELLPERKRALLDLYYNEDYSLAEIAEEIGISRQGVRGLIKKTEAELFFYEEKLGLARKLMQVQTYADSLCRLAEDHSLPDSVRDEILRLAQAVRESTIAKYPKGGPSMFQSLSEKLENAFKKFKNKGKLTEADVKAGMREIKLALLEADVNFKVVKDFIGKVSERAVGTEVLESLLPAQQIVKIVNEELIALMGGSQAKLTISS